MTLESAANSVTNSVTDSGSETPLEADSLARPDLTGVPDAVVAYIQTLEDKLAELRSQVVSTSRAAEAREPAAIMEAPTTVNVISISRQGRAKRTPRHLYGRQRRGGMGVFDLETGEQDQPAFLALADESAYLTLVTNRGRAFRLAVRELPEITVHGRGEAILGRFSLGADEELALAFGDPLPGMPHAYLSLISERGQVRRMGSQALGKNLQAGTVIHNVAEGGAPAACCWSSGSDDIFLVTRNGVGIRFSERHVPVRGCLGMRVDPQDRIVGAAACGEEDGVFLLTDEGKGTIRLMRGFSANKSPGTGGKIAIKADAVVGVAPVRDEDVDLFAISRLGKIIRFAAAEVPPKEGVVQGVNCMNLRADQCVAVAAAILAP